MGLLKISAVYVYSATTLLASRHVPVHCWGPHFRCPSQAPSATSPDANLRLVPKQKVAVVGPNGAGKSTLIRACVGKLAPEGGRIIVSRGVHVGYLEQTAVSGSERSVWDEAASRMDDINQAWEAVIAAEEELMEAEERGLGGKEVEAIAVRLMEHQERLEAVGGYRKDEMIAG